jgi:hypothetical protein
MNSVWDYDIKELEKTESGRRLILERKINYGADGEKIQLKLVKKYWDKLDLFLPQKRLLELIIWGKIISSQKSSKSFWMK